MIDLQNENVRLCHENELLVSKKIELTLEPIDVTQKLSTTSSKNSSSDSNSPEHFEIIDRNTLPVKKQDSIIDDNVSNNSLNESDWTNLTLNTSEMIEDVGEKKTITPNIPVVKSNYCKTTR